MTTPITEIVSLKAEEKQALEELEREIAEGLRAGFLLVGTALDRISTEKLYRDEFETFEAYCEGRWDFKKRQAYYLIAATKAVRALPSTSPKPIHESHVRELMRLPDEKQAKAWEAVVDEAPQKDGMPIITAKSVQTVVDAELDGKKPPRKPPKKKTPRDRMKREVPEALLPQWEVGVELRRIVHALGSVLATIKKQAHADGGEYLNVEEIERHIQNAQSQIGFGAYHCECPRCEVPGDGACEVCYGSGFIVKGTYARLSDTDKKKLA